MNKEYTCPDCSTHWDLWPDGDVNAPGDLQGSIRERGLDMGLEPHPRRIGAKCANCGWQGAVDFDTLELIEEY